MKNARTLVPALALLTALWCGTADAAQRKFHSAQEGVNALVAAVRNNDRPALIAILGPDGQDIVVSGDDTEDAARRAKFIAAYDAHSQIDQANPYRATLDVGQDNWQFPIPLVKTAGGWHFDTKAGKEEL